MALFESYERREKQILDVLAQYDIKSIEECREICQAKGFDPYKIVEGIQPIHREEALEGEDGVEGRAGMALRADQFVAVSPGGVLGVVVHLVEVECSHQIGCREGAAEVVRLIGAHHAHNVQTHLRRSQR